MTPEQIYAVVAKPTRPEHDQGLTDPQKRRLSEFMGGYRQLGSVEAGNPKNFPNQCASNPPMTDPAASPSWSGWGADISNTRFQSEKAAGIAKADVPKLKLKWAFGFPLGISAYSPPAIVSGRIFVGTDIGWVYSLDAKSGCIYWGLETGITVRPAISIGPVTGQGNTKYAIYFGDAKANVYGVDAQTGKLLWKRPVGTHDGHEDDGLLTEHVTPTSRDPLPASFCLQPSIFGGIETQLASNGSTTFAAVNDLALPATPAEYTGTVTSELGAVEKATGEMVAVSQDTGSIDWDTPLPSSPYGAATVTNDVVLTTTFHGDLYALNAATGAILLKTPMSAGSNAPVAVDGDYVIAGAGAALSGNQQTLIIAYRLGGTGKLPDTVGS
jgi:outer membrane protein assembly factor BamB